MVGMDFNFWWFMLFGMLVVLTAISIDEGLGLPKLGVMPDDGFPTNLKESLFATFRVSNGPLETIVGLLLFIPLFSLMVRRLHDVGLLVKLSPVLRQKTRLFLQTLLWLRLCLSIHLQQYYI